MRTSVTSLMIASLLLAAPLSVLAGPLSPPAGPVTSTHKTLTEVEPRTPVQSLPGSASALHVISQPGSYYLTGNITGVSGKNGIEITSDNVSLDLGGFQIQGVSGAGTAVFSAGPRINITIRNGALSDWPIDGLHIGNGTGIIVRDLHAARNGSFGIFAAGHAIVQNCTALYNGQRGITAYGSCRIHMCTVDQRGGSGIDVNYGCTVSECTIFVFQGAVGIVAREDANVIESNLIQTGSTSQALTCTGISCNGPANRVADNHLSRLAFGVSVTGTGNLIIRNTAQANTVAYSIAGGNDVGPIGSAATSTSPFANIE